jgi:hypothetical protein
MTRLNVLLNQSTVVQLIGEARLQRLLRAGWIAPQPRTNGKVLYASQDVRAVIRRLERGGHLPPERIEVARVRACEKRHGRGYVRKRTDQCYTMI